MKMKMNRDRLAAALIAIATDTDSKGVMRMMKLLLDHYEPDDKGILGHRAVTTTAALLPEAGEVSK